MEDIFDTKTVSSLEPGAGFDGFCFFGWGQQGDVVDGGSSQL